MAIAAVYWAQPANAQEAGRDNNQTFVIGGGLGTHRFSSPHRVQLAGADLTVNAAIMEQIYGEWYALDRFGVGLRITAFGESVSSSASVTINGITQSATSEAELRVDSWLVTAHWVPLGGKRYARMGVLAGLGKSNYEFTVTNDPGGTESITSSGPAALLGVYIDWGADGFGARAGAHYLATNLDDTNGSSVDVSGTEIYVDLRWAF